MQSMWYAIVQAVGAQLNALAAQQEASYLDNPALPLDMGGKGERALFFIHRGDKLTEQPGQRREKRKLRVVVGALALTKTALADADALHFAARDTLKAEAFRVDLRDLGAIGPVREVELEPELKDMATEGSVLLSAYEIEYFQTYPNAA